MNTKISILAPVLLTSVALVSGDPAAAQEAGVSSYGKGFTIEHGENRIGIMGRIQGRFTHEALNGFGGEGEDADETYFTLQRTRMKVQGRNHSSDLSWKFELDFGKDKFSLKDYFLDWNLGSATLRVGQFKKPFSRQRLTSSGSLEFVDRTANMKAFNADRDVGLMLHNNIKKSPVVEWAVGLFNGQGPNTQVDNMSPMLVARAGYNYNGIKGYSEADLEGGGLRFGVAAGLMSDLRPTSEDDVTGETVTGDPTHIAQADFSLKANGFATTGEFFLDLTGGSIGAQLQAGYLLGGQWQPGLRGVYLDQGDGDTHTEVGVALSSYLLKHKFKWQNDVSMVLEDNDIIARSQIQLAF